MMWSQDPELHAVGPMEAFARDLLDSSIPPSPTPLQSSLALTQGAERKMAPLPPASRLPAPSPRADGPQGTPSATLEDTLSQEEMRILGVLLETQPVSRCAQLTKADAPQGPFRGAQPRCIWQGPRERGPESYDNVKR